MPEIVKLEAADLLTLLSLISECIEDLAPEEQDAVDRGALILSGTDTFAAYRERCQATGAFYQVAVEGGLMSLGPDHSDGSGGGE